MYLKKVMKKGLAAFWAMAIMLTLAVSFNPAAYAGYEQVEDAQQSVVRVFVELGDGWYSTGTGFLVGTEDRSTDIVVTNYHVIKEDPDSVQVTETNMNGGIRAEVIFGDEYKDIAILELSEKLSNREPITLLSPTQLHKSQDIYCIGFPGLSDVLRDDRTMSSKIEDMTITKGTVSNAQNIVDEVKYVLSDVKVNPGNSGGPMVDEFGQAVGINTMIVSNSNAQNNMTLAVSIDYVTEKLDDLGIEYYCGSSDGESQTNSKGSDSKDESSDKEWLDDIKRWAIVLLLVKNWKTILLVVAGVLVIVVCVVVIVTKKKKTVDPGNGGVTDPGPEPPTAGRKMVLSCERGPIKGKVVEGTDRIRIGRNPQTCQMIFPDGTPGVSREHCEVQLTHNGIILTDLNSSYGTIISTGEKLSNRRKNIGQEEIILLGSDKNIVSVKIKF